MANKKISDLSALAASDAAVAANQLEAFAPALAVGTRSRSVRFDVLRGAMARLGRLFDVTDPLYGGKGDAATDNATAFANAIADAEAADGGLVFVPPGVYFTSEPIVLPHHTDMTLGLIGGGLRHTTLVGLDSAMVDVVRLGAASPDPSGTETVDSFYGLLSDLTIQPGTGAEAVTGLHLVQAFDWTISRILVQNFSSAGGKGVYLQGSTTTGLGSAAAPHCWQNAFYDLKVSNCRTPLHLLNADENDFYHARLALPTLLSVAADSLSAIDLAQGHNNGFFGLLLSGERTTPSRNGYVGLRFRAPVAGEVSGNMVHRLVTEGFDIAVLFEDSSYVFANSVKYHNSSIDANPYIDQHRQTGRRNEYHNPIAKIDYYDGPRRSNDAVQLTLPLGASTPDCSISNTFTLVGNAGGSQVTGINAEAGINAGRVTFILTDSNVDFTHGSSFQLSGSVNWTAGKANDRIVFEKAGGVWYETSRVVS